MEIKDLMIKDAMIMDLQATDKKGAIDEMVQKMYDAGRISDIETYKKGILAREAQTSTGLGDGIAMPHAKNAAVKEATVLFAKSNKGVDYEALDGQPTFLFFMIAAPEGANDTHLQALAALSRLLIDPDFVGKLKEAGTPEEVQELFQTAEQQKEAEAVAEQEEAAQTATSSNKKFVVAVTACPTGIAHTYMAEDALKKKAKEMGVEIKVETNGSEGIKNRLTAEDIARADGVIIAADKKVEMNRFDGKELVNRPVSDGIRKTEELINLAVSGSAPVFHGDGKENSSDEGNADGTIGQRIYKDLMNGVSHMLPFVIGGGIAIALSFMVDQFMGVPQDQLANLGNYNQAASWFNQIGQAAFGFMLPVLAGFIASSIGDRPGLIVGFAAGALANAGGAGFLGALIGGFLAGYVIVFLRKLFKNLPKSLEGIKTILFYPVFGLLITGFLMLMVNVPMKALNDGLNSFLSGLSGSNAALLGALLAGMMAADLGGPINKAAYVFGTATLATTVATGGSVVMASVMAGGMVPPLAIFVATRLFKNKFSKTDQDAGLTNIVMGLSFVTEGSIPFAAADPIRAIPSFIIGSALTGGLVGAFGIKLLAPHGGIFVVFLLSHPIMYLVFIAIGAIVSGVIYGALRKSPDAVEVA
ncbi:fructose-specific PTS transporter subunit EIIC [Enterococcus mundtii]|uniref:PTS fructose transporter subunit IIABC n=1 Tax=Enterococcus TaxID=1350 RepID=UPI000450B1D1|nr:MULTISPECIES: fructose-specific PTS transporter subunit EIIC [Enterococcus]AZP92994.1 PTS fructose transporter subunit IIC [Enterococcus mundtii]EYT95096.1 PTS fructose transporter subunit IIC [Enterococcus mundtii CRL35]MDA9428523.1 PTS system, fructose-specific IIA component [Enterococcus mundtii 1A]MDK4210790.1 fructose-specific PTS transporter subunit EIIC [Enterococcus mundtii]MDO7877957.1 fructose-specific PTS transporter subunit EIIC [Enterococcus mundtii]